MIGELHIITDVPAPKHLWLDLLCYDSMVEVEREEDGQDEKKVKKEVRLRWNHISRVSHSNVSNFPAKLLKSAGTMFHPPARCLSSLGPGVY